MRVIIITLEISFQKYKSCSFRFMCNARRKGKNPRWCRFWTTSSSWLYTLHAHSRANINSLMSVDRKIVCRSSIKSFPFFAVHPRVMSSRLNSSSKFRHGASCFTMPYATRIDFEFLHFVAGSSANSSSIFSTRYSLENSAMQTMLLNIYIYSSLTIRSRLVFVCNNEIETVIRYMGWVKRNFVKFFRRKGYKS